eukprot:1192167-Prorocentrum_minimum.AAC.1
MSAKWVRLTDYDMLLFGDDRGNIHSYKFDDLWGGTNVPNGANPKKMKSKGALINVSIMHGHRDGQQEAPRHEGER